MYVQHILHTSLLFPILYGCTVILVAKTLLGQPQVRTTCYYIYVIISYVGNCIKKSKYLSKLPPPGLWVRDDMIVPR